MQLHIKNLRREEVQRIMVLWARLRGPEVKAEDFIQVEDPTELQEQLEGPRGAYLAQPNS
jgi:hypothetical protein